MKFQKPIDEIMISDLVGYWTGFPQQSNETRPHQLTITEDNGYIIILPGGNKFSGKISLGEIDQDDSNVRVLLLEGFPIHTGIFMVHSDGIAFRYGPDLLIMEFKQPVLSL